MKQLRIYGRIVSALLFAGLLSCNDIHVVVEEKFPDGTSKRVCVYKGEGRDRELQKETVYYPSKNLQMEGTYKSNKRDGKWTYRYENGKIWSEGYFRDGKSNGKRTTYYESGKIRYEGFYRDDKQVGIWRFYDEAGRMVKEVDYSAIPK